MENEIIDLDVETIADSLKKELTDAEIQEVLKRYPAAQNQDETANWSLVVEDLIYQVINERK
ncbi:MAG TPA: hypothetical protein VIH28_06975 [Ignavibacteriaceae bacterium]